MASSADEFVPIALILAAFALLLIYGYIWSIRKIYASLGFNRKSVSAILLGILIFGSIPIPLFPYGGWIVALSVGGAIIPALVSIWLIGEKKLLPAEGFVGIVIVAFITYFITRAEPGVGIVADIELAFMPAIAAALFSLSVFWQEIKNAAPLAFFSGTLGTIIGADIFHLAEILESPPTSEGMNFLVMGGANIFDMVFLSGIVAVSLDLLVAYALERRKAEAADVFLKYQKDLISEYEKRRKTREREIEIRSMYWEKGIPYDPKYRIVDEDIDKQLERKQKYSADLKSQFKKNQTSSKWDNRSTFDQLEQLRKQMRNGTRDKKEEEEQGRTFF